MKTSIAIKSITGLLALLVLGIPVVKAQDEVNEQVAIPLSKPGDPGRLDVDQINGNITVSSYEGSEVIIKATTGTEYKRQCDDCDDVQANKNNDGSVPPGMKRIAANPLELNASEENNVVQVETESWNRRIHLDIRVPQNFDLNLNTVHGDIKVTGIKGAMDISSVNGAITLDGVSGSVITNTVNGGITVSLTGTASGVPMSFVTLNGTVDVTLPPAAKATAKMRSERGEIYSDFDMALERSKPDIRKSNDAYEVSINSWVYGKINGGGPEYTFKNMNGNIIVRKGK